MHDHDRERLSSLAAALKPGETPMEPGEAAVESGVAPVESGVAPVEPGGDPMGSGLDNGLRTRFAGSRTLYLPA